MYFPSNESHLQITLSFFAFEKPTPSTKTDIESTSSINSRNTKPNIETVQKNLIFDSPDIQIINENFISNSRSNKEDHISHHQSEMASKNDGQHTKQYLFQKEDDTSSLIKGSSYPPPIPVNPPPSITTSTLKVFKESIEERKTFSTMSTAARLLEEATVSEKRWSSQPERVVEGTPPKPEDNPNTRQGGEIRHALTGISPYYKSGVEQTQAEHRYGSSSNLEYQTADYKVKEKQEHSRMKIIDPHVNSNSNIPASKTFKPTNLLGDFPSQHTHKSFMKVDPLEQKRFKSLERMPVTTTTYLAESVGRHREMEASKLRNYLKTNENDASKLWDKPDWPGHKQEDTENLKELERMKLAIESLSKEVIQTKTRSMNDLSRPPPSTKPKVNTEGSSRSRNQDPGWLIRMRTNKYLQNAAATASGGDRSRAMSADNLNRSSSRMSFASEFTNADDALKGLPDKDKELFYSEEARPDRGGDPVVWNHKKLLNLSKFSEKRTTTFETHQEIRQHSSTSQQTQNQQRGSSVPRLPIQRSDSVNPDNANRVNYQGSPLVLPEPTTPPTIQSSTPIAIQPTQPRHEFHDRLMSPTFDRQSSHQTPKPILKQNYKSASQLSEQETGYCYQHYQEAHVHQSNVVTEPNDRSLNKHNMTRPLVDNSKQPQFNGLRSKSPLENNSNAPQNTQRTHRLQSHSPQPRSVSTTFEMLDEEERMRIMQENLRKHRQRNPQNIPKKTQRYPTAPYNGPFFELEEVSRQTTTPSILKNNENYQQKYQSQEMHHYQEQHQSMNKEMSSSEMELHRATNYSDFGNPNNPMQNNGVVIWPPIQPKTEKEISRPPSAMAKSMLDPERRAEFERQRHQEYEAMRQREEEKRISMEKQMKAIIIQQEKLSEQQHVMQSEVRSHSVRPHVGQNYQPINVDSDMQSSMHEVYNNVPSQGNHIRIYETRPISVMSTDQHSPGDNDLSPNNNATWKRTYVLDSNESRSVEKNEIVSSEELLEKEQYEIDILKRRSAFVEKPTQPPPIQRLGKRWQPPAEEPYIWPQLRKPLLIDADHPVSGSMYSPGNDDGEEYRWAPLISDPHYRKENKNFTPEQSPPSSPRRFLQMQTLDEVNRRQTKNVIRPSPDGSHRPLPMFKAIRNTPSGGFYPHAPNAIKVVKKRLHQSHSNINAEDYYTGEEDVQIIHERNFHGVDGRRSATTMGRSQSVHDLGKDDEINDWDKIYDLPAHSSTITGNDVPHNVNLRKRLAQFESQASLIHQKYAQQQERERRVSEAYNPSSTRTAPHIRVSHESSSHHGHDKRLSSNKRSASQQGLHRISLHDQTAFSNVERKQHTHHHSSQQQRIKQNYRSPSVPPTLLSSSSGGYHHQNNPSAGNSQHSGSSYSRKHPSTTPIIHHPSNNPTPVPQNAGLLRRVDSRNGPKTYHTSNQQLNIPPPPPQMMIPPVPVARPRTSVRQQHQRPHSVTPQMLSQEPISRRGSKFRESQPSPIPPSYNTARAFVPPPLPAGYRRPPSPPAGYSQLSPRSPPPPQNSGHTKKLAQQLSHKSNNQASYSTSANTHQQTSHSLSGRQSVPANLLRAQPRQHPHPHQMQPKLLHRSSHGSGSSQILSPKGKYLYCSTSSHSKQVNEAPKNDVEFEEYMKLKQSLAARSNDRQKDFKLVGSDIIKTDPDPVPEYYKEQLRELLESRISAESSAPSPFNINHMADRSGYVTDASSTTWQFNNSFSPRSIVSVNGAENKLNENVFKVRTNNVEKRYNASNNSSVTNSVLAEQEPIVREFTETYSRVMVRNADKHKNLHQEAVSRMEPVRSLKALPSPPSVRVPLPPKVLSPSLANNSEQHRNLSSTIIELKDDKPRGIIKPVVATKPRVTETIKRIEETKRTEEIERRVQRKEKKHRSHRYHHNDFHMSEGYYNGDNLAERRKVISEQEEEEIRRDATRLKNRHRSSSVAGSKKELREYHEKRHFTSQEMNDAVRSAYDAVDSNDMRQQQRSSSMNRQGMLPYYPSQENYNRSSTTRRGHSSQDGGYTQQHQQQYGRSGDFASNGYGSLSDSLRRGEVRYNPNGDVHEVYRNESRGHRRSSDAGMGMHKSFSTRDVYRDTGNYGTFHRNGNNQQPYIEFPPTLPRRQHPGEPPIPPPHRSASQIGLDSHYRPISKAHSYADWQHKGSNFGNFGRRHDGDMSRMENEFRDSLLIPTTNNGGVVNDREHRVEQIPGGFEEYDRKVQGNSGRRLNRDGIPTDFREASHEYSFKRETAH